MERLTIRTSKERLLDFERACVCRTIELGKVESKNSHYAKAMDLFIKKYKKAL